MPKTPRFLYSILLLITTVAVFYGCKKEPEKIEPQEEPRFFSPSLLKCTVDADSVIRVSWKDNSNVETAYQIQRKFGANSFSVVKETKANDTVYLDKEVLPNTIYTYRVRAISKIAETSFSDEVSIKLDLPIPALALAVVDESTIKVNWTDNSALETGFILERSKDGQNFSPIAQLGKNIQTYTDNTLEVNTTYFYRVKAKNKSTETAYSNLVNAKINFLPPSLNLNFSVTNTVNLTWTDNAMFEKGYVIEQSINGGAFSELTKVDSAVTNYRIENLQLFNRYSFRVKAYSVKNTSAFSNIKRIFYNNKRYIITESYNAESSVSGEVDISPSTEFIASTGYYSSRVIINNRINKSTRTLVTGHTEGGYCVRFSNDNASLLVSGAKDGYIEIYSTSNFSLTKKVATGLESVYSLKFNKSGSMVAVAGSGSSRILVYDFPAMTLRNTLNYDNSNVRDVEFYDNDTKLITAGNDDKISVWSLSSQRLLNTFTGHTGHIGTIELNKNSSLLASGSYEDKSIKIWNMSGSLLQTISNAENITSVFFDVDNNVYFTDLGGNLKIANSIGSNLYEINIGGVIHYAAFIESSNLIVIYNSAGAIKVLRLTPVWQEY